MPIQAGAVPRSRRWPIAVAAFAAGAIAAVAVGAVADSGADSGASRLDVATTTVAVEQRDLSTFLTYDGELASPPLIELLAGRDGTVTDTVEVGSALTAGDVVLTVDDTPIVLAYGDLPPFRDLDATVEDGPDVRQLELFLVTQGHDPDGTVTIDESFTSNTAAAVRRWQASVELDETGEVAAGTFIFVPGPITISETVSSGSTLRQGGVLGLAALQATIETIVTESAGVIEAMPAAGTAVDGLSVLYRIDGEPVSDSSIVAGSIAQFPAIANGESIASGRPVFTAVAASGRSVTLFVAVAEVENFAVGLELFVDLATGETLGGTVIEVGGTVATTTGQGQNTQTDAVVEVIIDVPEADRATVEGPVEIRIVDEAIPNALVVPTRALLALAEGGVAVEVQQDGGTRLVGVETGLFVDGVVAVTAELEPGDLLVVPA